MKLLYAEDDENDAFFMRRACAQIGNVSLTVVTDGQRAIELLGRVGVRGSGIAFDAVLLDINMPLANGHAVLNYIRQQDKLARIPVIMFSSSREKDDISASQQGGANAYLVKPTVPGQLPELLKGLVAAVQEWKAAKQTKGLLPLWGNLLTE